MYMRKLVLMLLVIAVFSIVGAQVMAGALNPETFESYSIGTWSPTEAKDGWKLGEFGRVGEPPGGQLISTDIKNGGIDGKYLRIVAGVWRGQARWKASLDKGKTPRQVFEITFRIADRATDFWTRWAASILIGPDDLDTVFEDRTVGGIAFADRTVVGISFADRTGGAGGISATLVTTMEEAIPGGTNWKTGDWFTVQVELDYTNETVRARFGPAGGKFNDWTKPMFMKQTGQYESINFLYNGTIDIDNLRILPAGAIGTF